MKRSVKRVVDGDTFETKVKVNGSNYVRLANVNAPEINARGGLEAKKKLKKLLGSKPVTIKPVGRSYSRVVAVVKNGYKNVNKTLNKK